MKNTLSTSLILLSIFSTPAFADYPELIKSNPKIKPMEKTNPNPINVAYSPTDPNWKKIVINKDIAEITGDEKVNADISQQPQQQNVTSSETPVATTEVTEETTEQTTASSNDKEKEPVTPSNDKEVEKTTATEKNSTNEKDTSKKSSDFSIHGFQLGAGFGILNGASAHIGYRIPYNSDNFFKNRFGFRLEYNTWDPFENDIKRELEKHPIKIDGNEISASIKGDSLGLLIDFYPFSYTPILGNFRISTGYYFGGFSLNGSISKNAGDRIYIQGSLHEALTPLTANVKLEYLNGPYAGLGFDLGLLLGLKLYFDAGLVFTKDPKITTELNGAYKTYFTKVPNIQGDLLHDIVTGYKDKIDANNDYYPLIKLGILLRF